MFGIADVYTAFFIVLGILIAFPGTIALLVFGLPNLTERSRARVEKTPVKCFMMGLPIVAIGGLIAAGLMGSGGPLAAAGAVIAVAIFLLSITGAAGVSLLIGQRMFGTAETIPLKPVIMGALAYKLASLFPIIGWVFLFPIQMILTTGAGVFALLKWAPPQTNQPDFQPIVINMPQTNTTPIQQN
ncbi:MAG: hypothetical protein AAF902_12155 [Chloroflexota bacterium]